MSGEDKILNIKVEYKKYKDQEAYESDQAQTRESLEIDRTTELILIEKTTDRDIKIHEKYHIHGGVEEFFKDLDLNENLFIGIDEGHKDLNPNPLGILKYKITVQYEFMEKTIEGDFDKQGLPSSYKDFVQAYRDLIATSNFYEILNP